MALNTLIDMQENERKRIAGDMHDQIGPMLSAVKLKINTLKLIDNHNELELLVNEITNNMDTVIRDVRQIVRNLSPTNLEKHGLVQAIEDFKSVIEKNHIRFEFIQEGMENGMKENARMNIYRIIAELINNSLRHSDSSLIKLIMKSYEKKTIIVYTDNGTVHDEDESPDHGMGLKSIESRVTSFRGKLFCKPDFINGAFYQITFDNQMLFN